MNLRDLYEAVILEHNRHPRHYPENPPGSNHHAHGFNPLCNDEIQVHLRVEDGVIRDAGFEGAGCAVSVASASMMMEAIQGRRLEEVRALFEKVHAMLAGDGPAEGVDKLKVLAGVKEFPMRVKCATLAWHALLAALDRAESGAATADPEAGAAPIDQAAARRPGR